MEEHLMAMVDLIIEMAEITADRWIELAEAFCEVQIPDAKRRTLTRLFNQMDASERLHALTVMLLLSKKKLSDPFVDLGIRRGSLPIIAAFVAIN